VTSEPSRAKRTATERPMPELRLLDEVSNFYKGVLSWLVYVLTLRL
jgi:hypothetical protein